MSKRRAIEIVVLVFAAIGALVVADEIGMSSLSTGGQVAVTVIILVIAWIAEKMWKSGGHS